MALSGKKITELNPISDVTNKIVLPAVYVDATKTQVLKHVNGVLTWVDEA